MNEHLRRSNWTKMVMTDLVIKAVNEVTGNEVVEDAAKEAAEHPVSKGDAVAEVEMNPELASLP
jgi:hypothetical protein